MKTRLTAICALILVLMITGSCAAGSNQNINSPNDEGKVAGFWLGLWHGIIAPVTFIVSLFTANVNIYEVHNNGIWYNLGYILGLMIILGGSGGGAARKRRIKIRAER